MSTVLADTNAVPAVDGKFSDQVDGLDLSKCSLGKTLGKWGALAGAITSLLGLDASNEAHAQTVVSTYEVCNTLGAQSIEYNKLLNFASNWGGQAAGNYLLAGIQVKTGHETQAMNIHVLAALEVLPGVPGSPEIAPSWDYFKGTKNFASINKLVITAHSGLAGFRQGIADPNRLAQVVVTDSFDSNPNFSLEAPASPYGPFGVYSSLENAILAARLNFSRKVPAESTVIFSLSVDLKGTGPSGNESPMLISLVGVDAPVPSNKVFGMATIDSSRLYDPSTFIEPYHFTEARCRITEETVSVPTLVPTKLDIAAGVSPNTVDVKVFDQFNQPFTGAYTLSSTTDVAHAMRPEAIIVNRPTVTLASKEPQKFFTVSGLDAPSKPVILNGQ